jgi:hypothetical protein
MSVDSPDQLYVGAIAVLLDLFSTMNGDLQDIADDASNARCTIVFLEVVLVSLQGQF